MRHSLTDRGDELVSEDLVECAHCQGMFLPEDMDGEHCRDCAEALFGD